MLKLLFLVQDVQKANLDRLYEGVVAASDCELHRLNADEQQDLAGWFRDHRIDPARYDAVMIILRSKKVMEQVAFLKTLPNLVFLEHDAWQNFTRCKYRGKFSALYQALPDCTVISSGAGVTARLRQEGVNAHFVPKGYDQALLSDLGRERDIECAFVGRLKNDIYRERVKFLEKLSKAADVQLLKTAPGKEYLDTLNRIRFFISADIGFGEYMLKNFEAMACGCVLFAFDQGEAENRALGLRDMENVVLYRDLEELLQKRELLRKDPALQERIRQAGRQLAETQFRFDLTGSRIVSTLASLRLTGSKSSFRIKVLIPYFGKWPVWMPYYLQSLRCNPGIEFVFFTDCGRPGNPPDNATFIDISYADYCRLVGTRLGIDFAPENPIKLCDIKPALGFIHADQLEGADYWAFSDIDLVYGDLLASYRPLLGKMDLISNHATRVSGHFCLLRNTDAMNRLFMAVPQWQAYLGSQRLEVFDERHFSRLFISHKNFPRPLFELYNRLFNPRFRRASFEESQTTPYCTVAWHDGSFDFPDYWVWKQGKVYNSLDGETRTFPYFHFMRWKKREWKTEFVAAVEPSADAWKITTRGFLPLTADTDTR